MSINEKDQIVETKNNVTTHEFDSEVGSENDFSFVDVDRSKAGSTWMAYVNIVCVVIGTGILGLPMALRQGGWIGLLILFLAWGMSIYTADLLIRCLYVNGKARLMTYKEVATAAFGWAGGWVTFFFNAWILLGGPVLYLVLCGQNLNQLCKGTPGEIGDIKWTIISCAVAAIPFIVLKSMKDVAWISALGVLATFIVVFVVLIMSAIDKPNQVNVHHDAVNWNMFPVALSTIAFSFGGNVIYPHIEASMSRPKNWTKVAVGGLSSCGVMYLIVAVCGYTVYGSNVASPVYNSIPEGVAQKIAIIVITINILVSAPIYTTSFSLDIEDMCNITVERFGRVKEFIIRAILRLIIIAVITVVACTVPHFGALMSLIGAFGNCTLVFIFPVVFYLKLTGVRNKPIYELTWCALIILLGLVGLIFGTMEAIKELISVY
ncbi:MAG: transmembrane amino acid transporter protein-domain-containing protein [Benjaminiella poitrasii]|nr:MAG: transmembrane amino acid transporter protein-domain-containing protein [Benjaminiella poitrasii]